MTAGFFSGSLAFEKNLMVSSVSPHAMNALMRTCNFSLFDSWYAFIKQIVKSDSKFSALNSGQWIGFFSFSYLFEALVECDFILEVL